MGVRVRPRREMLEVRGKTPAHNDGTDRRARSAGQALRADDLLSTLQAAYSAPLSPSRIAPQVTV